MQHARLAMFEAVLPRADDGNSDDGWISKGVRFPHLPIKAAGVGVICCVSFDDHNRRWRQHQEERAYLQPLEELRNSPTHSTSHQLMCTDRMPSPPTGQHPIHVGVPALRCFQATLCVALSDASCELMCVGGYLWTPAEGWKNSSMTMAPPCDTSGYI